MRYFYENLKTVVFCFALLPSVLWLANLMSTKYTGAIFLLQIAEPSIINVIMAFIYV